MSIVARIEQDSKDALRAGDKTRLGVLRRARAAITNADIAAGRSGSEDVAVGALRSLVKQHRESIDQFRAGGRDDLVATEEAELSILESYLPSMMSADQIEPVVAEVIASEGAAGPRDLGRVMKAAMARLGGRAEGGEVRAVAQRLLEGDR